MNHFAVHLKLTHCKSNVLQVLKIHSQYIFTFCQFIKIVLLFMLFLINCIKLIIVTRKKFFKHLETYRKLKTKNQFCSVEIK